MTDEHLRQAIALHKAGNRLGARQILADIVRNDPRNEAAWLWLAGSVETADQKRLCLQRALEINPNNQNARLALEQLEPDIPQPSLADLSVSPSAERPDSQPPATATLVEGATRPPATESRTPVPANSGAAEQEKRSPSAKEKPLSTSMLVLIGALVILCLGSFTCAAYFYVQRLINNSQAVAVLVTSGAPNAGPAQSSTAAATPTLAAATPTLAAATPTLTAAPTPLPFSKIDLGRATLTPDDVGLDGLHKPGDLHACNPMFPLDQWLSLPVGSVVGQVSQTLIAESCAGSITFGVQEDILVAPSPRDAARLSETLRSSSEAAMQVVCCSFQTSELSFGSSSMWLIRGQGIPWETTHIGFTVDNAVVHLYVTGSTKLIAQDLTDLATAALKRIDAQRYP